MKGNAQQEEITYIRKKGLLDDPCMTLLLCEYGVYFVAKAAQDKSRYVEKQKIQAPRVQGLYKKQECSTISSRRGRATGRRDLGDRGRQKKRQQTGRQQDSDGGSF